MRSGPRGALHRSVGGNVSLLLFFSLNARFYSFGLVTHPSVMKQFIRVCL